MLMSGVKFQMLSNIMYEKTKLVNSENNSLSNSVENSNVERRRPRFVWDRDIMKKNWLQ